LQLAPTQASWLAAQMRASLARAAVYRTLTQFLDFRVVGAAERRYVGRAAHTSSSFADAAAA
jgi:hypothetical protein